MIFILKIYLISMQICLKHLLTSVGLEATKMWKDLTDTFRRKIKSGSGGDQLMKKLHSGDFFIV